MRYQRHSLLAAAAFRSVAPAAVVGDNYGSFWWRAAGRWVLSIPGGDVPPPPTFHLPSGQGVCRPRWWWPSGRTPAPDPTQAVVVHTPTHSPWPHHRRAGVGTPYGGCPQFPKPVPCDVTLLPPTTVTWRLPTRLVRQPPGVDVALHSYPTPTPRLLYCCLYHHTPACWRAVCGIRLAGGCGDGAFPWSFAGSALPLMVAHDALR